MVKLYQCWKRIKGRTKQNKTKQKVERCNEKAKEESEKVKGMMINTNQYK